MSKCNTKAIRRDLSTLSHNQAYPGIIQAYSGIFKTLCNPGISRTLTYSEPEAYSVSWHIQTPAIFRTATYSEHWHILNPRYI